MKRLFLSLVLLVFISGNFQLNSAPLRLTENKNSDSTFIMRLLSLPGIVQVDSMSVSSYFKGKYKILFLQPLDHQDPAAGYFLQRAFLNHKDPEKPMVVITEGYSAAYGVYPIFQSELTGYVDGNQLLIEHRYFDESVPDTLNWDYLSVANAAADHHKIIESLKNIYHGKWISTGISKGGQTAMFHKSLYPDDVDFSVAYVAPLNFGVEDGRHEPFLEKNGSGKARKAIRNFQLEVLERKDSLMPEFRDFVEEKNYTFRVPLMEVYDYCVLEYSFAFWQWSADHENIPPSDTTNEAIFKHFITVSSPDYFSIEGSHSVLPFFVQAAREIGYYGYDEEPFREYMDIEDAGDYLYEVFLPAEIDYPYQPETMGKVQDYFDENDPKVIFIYGEYDPWTASAIEFKKKSNMIKVVKKAGTHATRISTLPEKQREMVVDQIKEWLAQ